jgi:hypothetical protein
MKRGAKLSARPREKSMNILVKAKRTFGRSLEPDPYQKKCFFETLPFSGFFEIRNGSQRFTSYKE